MVALAALLLVACGGTGGASGAAADDTAAPPGGTDGADTAGEAGDCPADPAAEGWSAAMRFAIIADPHVTGEGERADALRAALDRAAGEDVDLVAVVGDIAWGDGLELAAGILAESPAPVAPVLGDNVVVDGGDEAWAEAMGPLIDALAARADDPSDGRGRITVEGGAEAWLENYAFTLGPLRFVVLDLVARGVTGAWSEMADLHDVDGGTLPFLDAELAAAEAAGAAPGSVVMLSHHPMHMSPGALDTDEIAALHAVTAPRGPLLSADWAGHYHVQGDEEDAGGGYEVHVTPALFDPDAPLRLVTAWTDGTRSCSTWEVLADARR